MNTEFETAYTEFQHIAHNTDGISGSSYQSSNGYEFVTWIDAGDEHPEPQSELIQWLVDTDDDTYEGMYKFSMTLPFETEATPADPIDAPESEDVQDMLELTEAQGEIMEAIGKHKKHKITRARLIEMGLIPAGGILTGDIHGLLNYELIEEATVLGFDGYALTPAGEMYLATKTADDASAGEIELTEDPSPRIAELQRAIALMQRELIELKSKRWLLRSQS